MEPLREIDVPAVRRNLEAVRERTDGQARVLVATKYLADEALPALAEAGADLIGENRLQDLERKQELCGDRFEWHFIGAVQSRKAAAIAERVSLIHSLCTESAAAKLERASHAAEVLVQVNVAGEESKAGVAPAELEEFLALSPVPVRGLMTMPPLATDPEASRPHFARLAELAAEHGLTELSMGTSQDWEVAVEEGATLIRLGSALLSAS